ncbi:beta-lactamase-like protein [Apodospora peruviana]|uniref:Beta-lactamase-like protein n=1 Tax=Apodospora peruviana TaxID=516989 RepID=A0AAE0M2B0_9PEZI|nr:beta-lactamase-like protein [Apodospora peruviana]
MSTFNGLVAEFPDIRVDFFRNHPELRPPLACFLSHVHSDHLAGLESLRSPFVYCSAATREILLRLERFPCRINYAKGIMEARIQRYKHLKTLLKPLPLETPTVLELEPGNHVRVTLFDANHCPGAVMFLFEGQGKAAIYTGDIRSEPWFVNTIARSPALVEYTYGLKTLDTIYLDTSFTDDIGFQTKAEGISELLQKVSKYPNDTIFHFQAWTYGYEHVWIALSKALDTKIHVDQYKMLIYDSLVAKDPGNKFGARFHLSPEAAGLMGFMCGNTYHSGCLTLDESVRLHSCEKGNYCQTVQKSPVVWIQPVITRLPDGQSIAELGVGGGGDDLEGDAELYYLLPTEIDSLLEIICDTDTVSGELKEGIRASLLDSVANGRKISLDLERSTFGDDDETTLGNAVQVIAKKFQLEPGKPSSKTSGDKEILPNIITFPYSRHSSYPELCGLLEAFKPKDVWPCTVNKSEWLSQGITVEGLFGQHCSGETFRHDELMKEYSSRQGPPKVNDDSQATDNSADTSVWNPLILSSPVLGEQRVDPTQPSQQVLSPSSLGLNEPQDDEMEIEDDDAGYDPYIEYVQNSQDSELSQNALEVRASAFRAMLDNAKYNAGRPIGLLSTWDHHTELEPELGES